MATILDFPKTLAATPVEHAAAEAQSGPGQAQIIIFPGVRIERWEDQSDPGGYERRPKRAAAVHRDTLDLLD